MTRAACVLALAMLALVVAGACRNVLPGGSSSGGGAKILDVYAASPSPADAKSLLGGGDWWTGAPTFESRPLNAASMDPTVQFLVIVRYANIGTAETWKLEYSEFDNTSSASTVMSNIQSGAGAGVSGPRAGDQALYYGQQLMQTGGTAQGGAPFETQIFIRSGQFVISSTWDRKDGFPHVSQLGTIANKLVSRLKDTLSGKVKSAPITADDVATLPPPNGSITLLGAVKLPVQALALMVNATAPIELTKLFTDVQVTDFLYGDYALDEDTHMEVQAALFTFTTTSDASGIFDTVRGSDTPDANGLIKDYNDVTGPGQYEFYFQSGTHLGVMICRSTSEDANEAASRACEKPVEAVSAAWASTLKG